MGGMLKELKWRQDGVERVVKLLPDGRMGFLAEEIRSETSLVGEQLADRLQQMLEGNIKEKRAEKLPDRPELAAQPLEQWEFEVSSQSGSVPVTACRPMGSGELLPCVIYLHGGGWRSGSRAAVQPVCRYLAQQGEALVVNVEYRLAPEYKWPAGLEDCWTVLCWVYENAKLLWVDRNRIVMAGDSAGGNLAALCAHRDRDRGTGMVRGQVLYYAALAVKEPKGLRDFHFGLEDYIYDDSQKEAIEPRILAIWNTMQRGENDYLPEGISAREAGVSPLWDKDFSGLPSTLLITAQYDTLTPQSRTYAKYLAGNHVPVVWMDYCGMTHGFIGRYGVCPQVADSVDEIAGFLKRI